MSGPGGRAPEGVFGQDGAYYVRFNGRDVPIHYGTVSEAMTILNGLRGIRLHAGIDPHGGIPR